MSLTPHRIAPPPRLLSRVRPVILHLALLAMGFVYVYPFLWMLGGSLKTPGEFFSSGARVLPEQAQWRNYLDAWSAGNFGVYFFNTVIVTVASTAFVVLFTSMAGYVLARNAFPGRGLILGLIVALYFLPDGYAIVPLFDLVNALGLLNTYWALILTMTAGGLIYFTILFAGYFTTLPRDIEEAAVVDGANFPTLFFKIAFPQAKPMAATVTLFFFMNAWNAFFIPLVLTVGNPKMRTLAVGMAAFVGENSTQWTWVCAGAVISILPVMLLFVFLQRYFVDAIAGAVKG